MSVDDLLSELRARRIELSAAGEDLAYDAPAGALTTALRAELVRQKAEVLAALRRRGHWPAWAAGIVRLATVNAERRAGLLERFEERARVLEYEANLERDAAERHAFQDLLNAMGGVATHVAPDDLGKFQAKEMRCPTQQ